MNRLAGIFLLIVTGAFAQQIEPSLQESFVAGISNLDKSFTYQFQGSNNYPVIDVTMESWALSTPAVEIGTLLLFLQNNESLKTRHLAFALGTTGLTAMAFKYGFNRKRPERRYKPRIWNSRYTPSFPSGHTASFAAYAMVMSLSYPETTPLMVGLTILTGYSQVYVGNHYLGDVVGGAILGYIVGSVFVNNI